MKNFDRLIKWLTKNGYTIDIHNSCVPGYRIVYVKSFENKIYDYLNRHQKGAKTMSVASFTWLQITVPVEEGECAA